MMQLTVIESILNMFIQTILEVKIEYYVTKWHLYIFTEMIIEDNDSTRLNLTLSRLNLPGEN